MSDQPAEAVAQVETPPVVEAEQEQPNAGECCRLARDFQSKLA